MSTSGSGFAKHCVEVGEKHGTVSHPTGSNVGGMEFTTFEVNVPQQHYDQLALEAALHHSGDVVPSLSHISTFEQVSDNHTVHVRVWGDGK